MADLVLLEFNIKKNILKQTWKNDECQIHISSPQENISI